MKHFFFLLVFAFLGGSLLNSCKEDIDLLGGFEETAVVYGLLDQSDSLHFIKITRAYIGPGNSLDIAKIPDSSYFNQVDATVTEIVNGVEVRTWTLEDTLVENKETNGIFYAPTQKVYYFATRKCKQDGSQQLSSSGAPASDLMNSLNENATYKLNVSINGGAFEVTGQTSLVKDIISPSPGGIDPTNYRYDFIENDGSYASNGLRVNTGTSHIMSATLVVSFDEMEMGVDTTLRSFSWNLGELPVSPNATQSFTMSGQTFYDLIKSNCSNNASINRRRMYGIEAIITGGSEELYNYIEINKPASTLAQSKPSYTNLTVSADHRVVGLFASRYTYRVYKPYIYWANTSLRMITVESIVELCNGAITGSLDFCSHHPADNGSIVDCN